ncbi:MULTISPECIES: hypothetical protein [Paenibacillus]|uniref:Signal peptide protein n=2 Tax=Paenibacillus alvei TaxID=44250 RepID=A0AAP7DK46_PAEAL|nr:MULTISPECIES: hypothetical protein [Paenibacillus]MBG9733324.1 Gram-positive signal peptide protein, YSIRK family [Paenibacillus alvei]MBG9745117.1 Gram-positive signal peptide protein, YSIRK family [Paenibacillus alvei]MCY9580758.1 signal peptide protein [Paenibacillus alvei]MCY9585241.1 signal peptide protein [Paenibacillus alvei]NEZ44997.1 signal peptide protein [Paenibacillus alvei]
MSHKPYNSRKILTMVIAIAIIILVANMCNHRSEERAGSGKSTANVNATTVPWDYKVESVKVGDLIGGDMTLSPDNELLPNDGNYATGDTIWALKYMTADMVIKDGKRNDVHLSPWKAIKTYPSKQAAEKELKNVKLSLKAEVELIGVYKTEYQGKYRQFAVMTLPSGHTIKQPINQERYSNMKNKKKVAVLLEEVHDMNNYDQAMAKFRGWAD